MTDMSQGEKKILKDIENYGWHVLKIMEDEQGPGFCYSIGFYMTFNHPEIVIVGLKPDLAHLLINNIGEDLKKGKTYRSGQFYSGILDNVDCLMLQVAENNYDEYFGYGLWYYKGNDFSALQCIYPTVNGIYPWENDWPDSIKNLQPILGSLEEGI